MTNKAFVNTFHCEPDLPCYCGSKRPFGRCCASRAEDRPPPNGVVIVKNYLSANDCRRLTRYADKQSGAWLMVHDMVKSTAQKAVQKRDPARVTQQVDMRKHQAFINSTVRDALRNIAIRQFGPFDWFETPYLLRYKVGGKYSAHADAEQIDPATGRYFRAADRDVSLLLYLNDDYEGGELRFTRLNYCIKPSRGDLVLFPSGSLYQHQAQQVTRGKKYALVSWASLKASQKLFPKASHSPRLGL